jgi:hypothetical protein
LVQEAVATAVALTHVVDVPSSLFVTVDEE